MAVRAAVGTNEKASLRQLHNVLAFLREPELGLQPRRQWVARVEKPFMRREPDAEARVLRVLAPISTQALIEPRLLTPPYLPWLTRHIDDCLAPHGLRFRHC